MPIYEFQCRKCAHQFETLVRGGEDPCCPECEGNSLEKLISGFAVGGGPAESAAPGSCHTCGDPRGPGT